MNWRKNLLNSPSMGRWDPWFPFFFSFSFCSSFFSCLSLFYRLFSVSLPIFFCKSRMFSLQFCYLSQILSFREWFSLLSLRQSSLQCCSSSAMSSFEKARQFQWVTVIEVEAVGRARLELIVFVDIRLFFLQVAFFFDIDCLGSLGGWQNTCLVRWVSSLVLRYLFRGYFLREVSQSQSMVYPRDSISNYNDYKLQFEEWVQNQQSSAVFFQPFI